MCFRIALFAVIQFIILSVYAADINFSIDGNTYKLTSVVDRQAELITCGYSSNLVIPDTVVYENERITVVGVADKGLNNALSAGKGVASVHLSSNIKYIDNPTYKNGLLKIYIKSLPQYLSMSYVPIYKKELYFESDGQPLSCDLVIPDSINEISCSGAFSYCDWLNSISWTLNDENWHVIPSQFCSNSKNLSKVILPMSDLEMYAFDGCSELSSITIINKRYKVAFGTFRNCKNIDRIDGILSGHTYNETFSNCTALSELTFDDSVHVIYGSRDDNSSFKGCVSLKRLNVSNLQTLNQIYYGVYSHKTNKIDQYFNPKNAMFYNAAEGGEISVAGEKLTKVSGANFPVIRAGLFCYVTGLTFNFNLVTEIEDYALTGCGLEDIRLTMKKLKKIGYHALDARCVSFSEIPEIDIADCLAETVDTLNIDCCERLSDKYRNTFFADNRNLKAIKIGYLQCDIPYGAFSNCTSLESFTVKESFDYLTIESSAFKNTNLNEFEIPEGITWIEGLAFEGSALKSLKLSPRTMLNLYCNFKNVSSWPNLDYSTWKGGSFGVCNRLHTLIIDYADRIQINKHIWNNIKYSEDYPWQSNITKIVFGNNTTKADVDLFVTSYGGNYNRTESQLRELEFGFQVSEISLYGGIKSNQYYCRYDKDNIERITVKNPNPPSIDTNFSDWTLVNAQLNVPKNNVSAYKAHPVWGQFWKIEGVDFPDTPYSDIKEIISDKTSLDKPTYIYNLQGFMLKKDATQSDIDALAPGLYIINGKKTMVK